MPQDIQFFYPGSIGDRFHKCSFCGQGPVEGKHVFLRVVFVSVIGLPVHVDGKVRDQDKITVYIHKSGSITAVSVFDDDPAGH